MGTLRTLIVASVAFAPLAAAGQAPPPAQSAPPPVAYAAALSVGPGMPYAPAEVRGYRLTDTMRLSESGAGTQYVFKHDKDEMVALLTPYVGRGPHSLTDTMAMVQDEVTGIRDALDSAEKHRQLQDYHRRGFGAGSLQVGGRTVRYYWFFAEVRRLDEQGKYIYYAAFALPYGLVRIRSELPWAVPYNNAGHATVTRLDQGGHSVPFAGPADAADNYGPYRDQLARLSSDLISDMVNHNVETPVQAAGSTVVAAQPTAFPAVCAASPAATDTVAYRVYATLEAPLRSDPLPPAYLDLVLDAFRHSLLVPHPLSPSVYTPMVAAGSTVMVPAVIGEVAFTLDDQGKVSDVRPTQSSLSPELDQSLYDAPRRADSLQAFPGQVGVDHPGPVRFFVALSPYQPRSGHYMPFFAVRMPAWRPGSRPAISPFDLGPVFSAGAQKPAAGDSVLIQFVVDEHGLPLNTTMRLLGATHLEYAKGIVDAALHSQYVPALAAGCPVKGLLERSWRMAAPAAP